MVAPIIRFNKQDGTKFHDMKTMSLGEIISEYTELCEKNGTYEHVSLTKEGVIPKSERYERDFLVTTEDKKYRVTHFNDICYNPANLKFGVICRNKFGDAIFSPIYVTLHVKDGFDPCYIELLVTRFAFIQRALRFQEGTVYERMAVSPEDLLTLTVAVPELEEQQKIADFLSSVDEVITTSEQEVANLETQKKAVMKKIFSQEVRFKREDGTDFPEWEEKRVDDVAVLNPKTSEVPQEFYYMDLGGIDHGIWTEKNVVSKVDAPSRAQRVASDGDIFFQSVRPYNMGHYWLQSLLDKVVVASTGFIQIRCRNDVLNGYLFQYLFEDNFNKEVDVRCTGQAYPAINADVFGEIVIGIPCFEEQRLIADFLSDFDEAIAAAKKELELWKELKKGLLQQMFV